MTVVVQSILDGLKRCSRCKQTKSLDQFRPLPTATDGRRPECVLCSREADRRTYMKHREKRLAAQKKSRDPVRALEYARMYRARPEHKEKERQRHRERRAAQLPSETNRRIRKAQGEKIQPLIVWELDDGLCYLCGEDVSPNDAHMDHVIPIARGGTHTLDNVRLTHSYCNLSKCARLPWEIE